MNNIIQADAMIQEGVEEFKVAAVKTATGIIEQGLAVLKIKQGCVAKQGGTDFPDVAMRELGLSLSAAKMFSLIGENAEKLVTAVTSLPSESMTTIYQISRMDEATIADKISRGIITPTASRDQVMEQVCVGKRRMVHTAPTGATPDHVGTVEEIVATLKPQQQRVVMGEVTEAIKEAKKEGRAKGKEDSKQALEDQMENDRQRTRLSQARRMVQDPFTREEYKLILGMLHPDRHPGLEDRAIHAFDTFKRIEPICKKVKLKAV